MISCKLMGGLSNQLYMISNILALSLKYQLEYCIPLKVDNPHYEGQKPYIFPGVVYRYDVPELPLYLEKSFEYEEIPLVDNVCFSGYFQSFKLLDQYREEILKALGFDWELKEGWVSLHYRAGDYRNLPLHHPIVSEEYLEKGIAHFTNLGYNKFLVFSDEIDTIEAILSHPKYSGIEFEFSEGRTELEDLQLASCCEHNLGSNSSFSLWLHWLNQNKNKIGVFPKKWFGEMLNHNTDTLYPTGTIIL